ncbi:MAG: PEP-CTERM sorting domain-containing protein [Armatimonadota bacterium]
MKRSSVLMLVTLVLTGLLFICNLGTALAVVLQAGDVVSIGQGQTTIKYYRDGVWSDYATDDTARFYDVKVASNGDVYVTNTASGYKGVDVYRDGTKLTSYSAGTHSLLGLGIRPSDGQVFVTDDSANSILTITNGALSSYTSNLGPFITRLDFGPDKTGDGQSDLFVTYRSITSTYPMGVFYVDGNSSTQVTSKTLFALKPDIMHKLAAWGPDGKFYVGLGAAPGATSVSVISRFSADGIFEADIITSGLSAANDMVWGPDVDGDGVDDLYVANTGYGKISVFSTSGLNLANYEGIGTSAYGLDVIPNNPVPEPGALIVLGSGVIGLACHMKHRMRQ